MAKYVNFNKLIKPYQDNLGILSLGSWKKSLRLGLMLFRKHGICAELELKECLSQVVTEVYILAVSDGWENRQLSGNNLVEWLQGRQEQSVDEYLLITIIRAVNRVKERVKRQRKKNFDIISLSSEEDEDLIPALTSKALHVMPAIFSRLELEAVTNEIAKLSERKRLIYHMRYLLQYRVKDIATVLKVTENAVSQEIKVLNKIFKNINHR